jgi:SAM-dependent methyltransferase
MLTENPFLTGEYHRRKKQEVSGFFKLGETMQRLRDFYGQAEGIINAAGLQYPLTRENPQVLLMGFEGVHTAITFIRFIHERNANAAITVADISSYPLAESVRLGIPNLPHVNLAQEDTTSLSFPDASFDMIETDRLLQFLSPGQKRRALAQWYRVLRPGGIVTTTDNLMQNQTPGEWEIFDRKRNRLLTSLGVDSYPATIEEMSQAFGEQGFSTVIQRAQDFKSVYHIVAKKPEAARR